MDPKIDYLFLPLVFVGLHVVSHVMDKALQEQMVKCAILMFGNQETPENAQSLMVGTCSIQELETKRKKVMYITGAAVIVAAVWVVRLLSGFEVGIGAAALAIPALFLVGQTLDCKAAPQDYASPSSSCQTKSQVASVVVSPAFWGTVAYTIIRLAHRF